ncbi:putative UDP-Gal or UDP-GlcNAc-dependent glycosyltransferase [Trypanosoma cruzi]|uniref:Putative UDP-Gal or UDP-GlcNAc-dependent glycosyltransferase n=1 Tax=Trypanosoma cruzi TaxID=5693 RepID=A0A2V2W4N3_TRYCR|nr:putative UDP-Gal or UDP-GlcNAc-dependent glycosyltransferase [Trypanosoma cruzi]
MAKPKLLTLRRKLKRVAVLLILFIVATTVLTLRFDTTADDASPGLNNLRHSHATAADDAALAYIPRSVVDTWSRREYLIVLGVPSIDEEARRTQRNLQRSTCWRFPGVATRANDFTGALLVLYVIGRHPSHGYDYSPAMLEEAAQWNDVVALQMNEGLVTTNKTVGHYAFLELRRMSVLSRKVYMWFDLALRLFPDREVHCEGR